jgi:hypothetical protein
MSCSQESFITKIKDSDKYIDTRLVGDWEGQSDEQIEGLTVEWEMTRKVDGTYILYLRSFPKGLPERARPAIDDGNWWIEDGTFFEVSNAGQKTDSYYYEVLDTNRIRFKAKKMSIVTKPNYEFIDYRIPD